MNRYLLTALVVVVTLPAAAPMATHTDPAGETTLTPAGTIITGPRHDPVLGLSCSRTDFVSAQFSRHLGLVEVQLTMADLAAECPGENPGYQVYSFEYHFTSGLGEKVHAMVRYVPNLHDVDRPYVFGGGWLQSMGAWVDEEADIVGFEVPESAAPLPHTEGILVTIMQTCYLQSCDSGTVPRYGDRLPDRGTLTYSGD